MGIKEKTAKDKKNSSSTSKQLWHLLRALYYILKHKLFVHLDLRLLLERSKVAVHDHLDSLTCRSMDPARAYYSPQEIEFSCSNTPTNYYSFLHGYNNHNKRKVSSRRRSLIEAEAAARVFMEMARPDDGYTLASPIALSQYMRSPAVACWQRRASDSPLPVREEEEEEAAGGRRQVDREAEEFIKRFYEQLRLQPTA